ncbi:hypothetical protein HNR42_002169 [Deinobacterium chartae]|uniref:SbsA Ig-like domain-containing protein n=1 Tax=Deinobacterium chartae TaxID=521158 RepID=A0A841I171_9DEIO|nr:Ig-like domain-containing protein [Deinobacterium chartae]MBB6098734.1 hypothetical protein [Deinobacterium chartae]
MRHTLPLALTLTALLAACSQPAQQPNQPDPQPGTLSARLLQPSSTTYVNGDLAVSAEVSGSPERVELLKEGEVLAPLTAPYRWSWDTRSAPEGRYALKVRASRGSAQVESSAVQVVVDRTAPTLEERSPEPGSDAADRTVRLTFSEALDPASVTEAELRLEDSLGATVSFERSLSEDGTVLTLQLAALPTPPARLTLTVGEGLRDLAGNALNLELRSWSWNYAEWTLLNTEPLEADISPQGAGLQAVAADGQGRVAIAWDQNDGVTKNVYVKRWHGQGFERLGDPISAFPASTPTESPSIAATPDGELYVAFAESDGKAKDVHVRRLVGNSWEPVGTSLSALPSLESKVGSPAVVTDPQGRPVVAWYEYDGAVSTLSHASIYVARWNGELWEMLAQGGLSASERVADNPRVAVAADGSIYVAWRQDVTVGSARKGSVHVRRLSGDTWEDLGGPQFRQGSAQEPSLVTVGNDIYLSYGDAEIAGSGREVRVQRWTGTAWELIGTPQTVNTAVSATAPHLAADSEGRLWLAWSQKESDLEMLYVRRFSGLEWESYLEGVDAVSSAGTGAFRPQVALSGTHPVIVWRERPAEGQPFGLWVGIGRR